MDYAIRYRDTASRSDRFQAEKTKILCTIMKSQTSKYRLPTDSNSRHRRRRSLLVWTHCSGPPFHNTRTVVKHHEFPTVKLDLCLVFSFRLLLSVQRCSASVCYPRIPLDLLQVYHGSGPLTPARRSHSFAFDQLVSRCQNRDISMMSRFNCFMNATSMRLFMWR